MARYSNHGSHSHYDKKCNQNEGDPKLGPSGVPVDTSVAPSKSECPGALAFMVASSVEAVTMTTHPETATCASPEAASQRQAA